MARVLIVDDEESDRLLQRAILERAGHDTFLAADGEEALTQSRENAIDVVVTDLQMPRVHGFELIDLLRDVSPRPVIVALSGTGPYQLEMANALGAEFSLPKPIRSEDLVAIVEQAVAARARAAQADSA